MSLSGYLRGHSCCTALLKMTEDWRESLDKREAVVAVAVDLSKAVCHSLLLAKLKAFGFSERALKLMTSYLCDRKQRVKLDGVYSRWRTVKTGVPQGSLLGPLLFNLYMNDLNYFVKDTSLRLYADDTTGYASDTSPAILEYVINSDLKIVTNWLQHNYLQINAKKTQAMAIGPISSYAYNITLQNCKIDLTECLRILGVTLDRKLSFKPHILEQLKKACAKAAALRKFRKFIPMDVMIRLYKAYVLPHLEYCSPLFLGISDGLSNKLEDINFYILRTILGYSKSVSYSFILNSIAKMQCLKTRRQIQSLAMVYKCMNEQGPEYSRNFFNILSVNYNLRGSGTRLRLPSFNLEYKHKSWSFLTVKLWNSIPPQIRESDTFAKFKNALNEHMRNAELQNLQIFQVLDIIITNILINLFENV